MEVCQELACIADVYATGALAPTILIQKGKVIVGKKC